MKIFEILNRDWGDILENHLTKLLKNSFSLQNCLTMRWGKIHSLTSEDAKFYLIRTSNTIKRSKAVIFIFIRNWTAYRTAKARGRPSFLSKRLERLIIHMVASKGNWKLDKDARLIVKTANKCRKSLNM